MRFALEEPRLDTQHGVVDTLKACSQAPARPKNAALLVNRAVPPTLHCPRKDRDGDDISND
jgi:hypothetical protein